MNRQMGDPESRREPDEALRARARTLTYERLALVSAVVWAVGTLIMFIVYVPFVARPQAYIFVASIVPLVPAALPWLFYERIAAAVARRWASQQSESDPTRGGA